LGQSLINLFGCLAPFLSDDLLESYPYTVALTLTTFPKCLHKCIVDTLCNTIIPIAIQSCRTDDDSFLTNSIASIIMIVIQYGDEMEFSIQLLECFLSYKRYFIQDILCSIAYGTYKVRYHVTNLLFRYWPKLNPNKSDRNIHYQFMPRRALQCQSAQCLERKNEVSKVCIDPCFTMHGASTPPPYYHCNECYRDLPKEFQSYCHNIVQPVEEIANYCENRNCKSSDKLAYVICYSSPCILSNQNKAITFCKDCHSSKHNRFNLRQDHIFQMYIDNLWTCDTKTRTYLNVSIINLLKDVPKLEIKRPTSANDSDSSSNKKNAPSASINNLTLAASRNLNAGTSNLISVGLIGAHSSNLHPITTSMASTILTGVSLVDNSSTNRRLLSRYGCYLIISLLKPNECEDLEIFGSIISMVLQWFHRVCYIPSDSSGELIAKMRTNHILPWIKTVIDNHFELVLSCLLPFPPDFLKIGGVWETRCKASLQIKVNFFSF
jgi:protein unc-79